MRVSSQPYIKAYVFQLLSLGTLLRILFLVLMVILPFFITYSTPSKHLFMKTFFYLRTFK